MTDPQRAADASQLAQWITGKWISHAIHAAAELSIADLLREGERSLEELAAATGAHAPSLYRLLRALASIGVFRESAPQRFESTRLGDLLRAGEMRAACLMMHSDWHDRAWSELTASVRTGESAFERAHGASLFDWLNQHRAAADLFSEAMTSGKAYRDQGIAKYYDFSPFRRIVDVGGGHGSLMISILSEHPHLTGVIADLPTNVDGAQKALHQAGLAQRCEVVATDFFEGVPEGGDVYVLAHVIHDWSDESSQTILRNCRRAMSTPGRLLLVESLMPDGDGPDRLKWLDLEMLVLTPGGRERTVEEYRHLLTSAGFHLTRVVWTGGSRSVVEAVISAGTVVGPGE